MEERIQGLTLTIILFEEVEIKKMIFNCLGSYHMAILHIMAMEPIEWIYNDLL